MKWGGIFRIFNVVGKTFNENALFQLAPQCRRKSQEARPRTGLELKDESGLDDFSLREGEKLGTQIVQMQYSSARRTEGLH